MIWRFRGIDPTGVRGTSTDVCEECGASKQAHTYQDRQGLVCPKERHMNDWWEIQADGWPAGQFLIVSERRTATVGSTLSLACVEAQRTMDNDDTIATVRLYHVVDDNRRFHGWYDRDGTLRREA